MDRHVSFREPKEGSTVCNRTERDEGRIPIWMSNASNVRVCVDVLIYTRENSKPLYILAPTKHNKSDTFSGMVAFLSFDELMLYYQADPLECVLRSNHFVAHTRNVGSSSATTEFPTQTPFLPGFIPDEPHSPPTPPTNARLRAPRFFQDTISINRLVSNNPDNGDDNASRRSTTSSQAEEEREQIMERAHQKQSIVSRAERRHFRLRVAIAASLLIAYYAIGIIFYTSYFNWDPFETAYFCTITALGIGYGDMPSGDVISLDDGAMVFSAFYMIFGVGTAFSSIVTIISEMHARRERHKRKTVIDNIRHFNENNLCKDDLYFNRTSFRQVETQDETNGTMLKIARIRGTRFWHTNPLGVSVMSLLVIIIIGVLFACVHGGIKNTNTKLENCTETCFTTANMSDCSTDGGDVLSFPQALYWIAATGTTVGYGDVHPSTDAARIFAIFYVFAIVGAMTDFLSRASSSVLTISRFETDVTDGMGTLTFDERILNLLDRNGDKQVDKGEWLMAYLCDLGVGDKTLCELILSKFDEFDSNNDGVLSLDDLHSVPTLSNRHHKHHAGNKHHNHHTHHTQSGYHDEHVHVGDALEYNVTIANAYNA
eukprot:m.226187 g.226187  ORF g.226187 m.226187 type:complete len:600 (-) comp33486_c0_seq3:179-1978(-)